MSYQDYYMPFGKHRGEHIDNVSRKYLEWLQDQDWVNDYDGLEEAIEEQLAMRDRSHVTY